MLFIRDFFDTKPDKFENELMAIKLEYLIDLTLNISEENLFQLVRVVSIVYINYSVFCGLSAAPVGTEAYRHRHRPIQTGTLPAPFYLDRRQSRTGLCRSVSSL